MFFHGSLLSISVLKTSAEAISPISIVASCALLVQSNAPGRTPPVEEQDHRVLAKSSRVS